MATLDGCMVERVPFAEAKALIVRHEWLRSMPTGTLACYGLKTDLGDFVGVVAFARGPAPESHDLCGPEHRHLAVCLARGACVHWAHPHAASFLISRACKLAHRNHGWKIFFAYADPRAGEIGAVYQACNWLYLGVGVGRRPCAGRWRFFSRREGRWRSTERARAAGRPCRSAGTSRLDRRMDARQTALRVVGGNQAREARSAAGAEVCAAALSVEETTASKAVAVMAMRIMAASGASRWKRPWRRSHRSGNPPKPA